MASIVRSAQGTAQSTSFVITPAATPTDGNLLVVFATCFETRTITPPSGWSTLSGPTNSTNTRAYTFYKIASSEGSSFTFSVSGSADYCSGVYYEINGQASSNYFNQYNQTTRTSEEYLTTTSLTPGVLSCLAITAAHTDRGTGTSLSCSSVDTGWTLDQSARPEYLSTFSASKNSLTSDITTPINNTFDFAGYTGASVVSEILVAPTSGAPSGNPWYYYAQQLRSLTDKWRGLLTIPSLEEVKLYGRLGHA